MRRKSYDFLALFSDLRPPVQIEKIINSLWISVDRVNSNKLDWICMLVEWKWHIVINKNMSITRQRFTLAHELKHYLDWENACAIRGVNRTQIEKDANKFAAELLIPTQALIKSFIKEKNTSALANKFWVSVQVMEIRLKNLGLIFNFKKNEKNNRYNNITIN